MNDKILIITLKFPPMKGVGGRRWAKFAKYLGIKGVNLTVISAGEGIKKVERSTKFSQDEMGFEHIKFPLNYPKHLAFLEFKKQTLFQRVMFHYEHYRIKKKIYGNYWDLSVFWKPYFQNEITEIINEKSINKLIISGAPFRFVAYSCELKKKYPNLEIIFDVRDPWNDINSPPAISEERKIFEIELEKSVMKSVDKIITVSSFQKEIILKNQPKASPIYVLPNGFDKADFSNAIVSDEVVVKDKIRLVHFGTLHAKKEYYWRPFFEALVQLKKMDFKLYNQIEVHLVGYVPVEVFDCVKDLGINIIMHGVLSQVKAYALLNTADVGLWFKFDASGGDFATKFGDYILAKKFIWTFSVKGEATEYIKKHDIGRIFYRTEKDLKSKIYQALLDLNDFSKRKFNPDYNSDHLDIENLTDELLTIVSD